MVSVHGEVTEWGLGFCPGLLYHWAVVLSPSACFQGPLLGRGSVDPERENGREGGGRGDEDEGGRRGREKGTEKERGGNENDGDGEAVPALWPGHLAFSYDSGIRQA